MLIKIDLTKDVPVFAQIAAAIRGDILTGKLSPGDRLPAAKEIAGSLGINVHTVLHAYQVLRDEGLLELKRGRGASVSNAASPLLDLREDILHLVQAASRLGVSREALASLVRDAPA